MNSRWLCNVLRIREKTLGFVFVNQERIHVSRPLFLSYQFLFLFTIAPLEHHVRMTSETKIESTAVPMESDSVASSHGNGISTMDSRSIVDNVSWSPNHSDNEKNGLWHYFPKYKLKRSGKYCYTRNYQLH